MAEETSDVLAKSYKTLATYISVFFLLYPIVWYIGLPGPLEVLNARQTSIAFVVLPFFCKQVYGFLDMYMIHKAEEEM
jgi:bacteriorhodopsin